jgi:16S rRNA U516 pseudouridylate synthase RsuA-like enzyme
MMTPSALRCQVADGRHHEVRELAKAADVEVVALKRTRIGGLRLPRDLL